MAIFNNTYNGFRAPIPASNHPATIPLGTVPPELLRSAIQGSSVWTVTETVDSHSGDGIENARDNVLRQPLLRSLSLGIGRGATRQPHM
jgi:hypothetical protein